MLSYDDAEMEFKKGVDEDLEFITNIEELVEICYQNETFSESKFSEFLRIHNQSERKFPKLLGKVIFQTAYYKTHTPYAIAALGVGTHPELGVSEDVDRVYLFSCALASWNGGNPDFFGVPQGSNINYTENQIKICRFLVTELLAPYVEGFKKGEAVYHDIIREREEEEHKEREREAMRKAGLDGVCEGAEVPPDPCPAWWADEMSRLSRAKKENKQKRDTAFNGFLNKDEPVDLRRFWNSWAIKQSDKLDEWGFAFRIIQDNREMRILFLICFCSGLILGVM